MTPTMTTATLVGASSVPVQVVTTLMRRLPQMVVIGLSAVAVRETAERVRSAITASGFDFPRQRVTVEVGPADLRKDGTHYDLAIALGVLVASGQIAVTQDQLDRFVFAGELSLSGDLRTFRGASTMARRDRIFVGPPEACELVRHQGETAYAVRTLLDATRVLLGEYVEPPMPEPTPTPRSLLDFSDVALPTSVIDLLVAAAVNRDPLLLLGPPGCGKTMIAARLDGLLPELTTDEYREVVRIHDAAGLANHDYALHTRRPFRAPHHSISAAGLVGNATFRPGELALAHRGVVLFDEWPEFPRACMELISHAHREKRVVLPRIGTTVSFPADFWFVAAANPCPCGGHRACTCPSSVVERWQERMVRHLPPGTRQIELPVLGPQLRRSPGTPTSELRARVAR